MRAPLKCGALFAVPRFVIPVSPLSSGDKCAVRTRDYIPWQTIPGRGALRVPAKHQWAWTAGDWKSPLPHCFDVPTSTLGPNGKTPNQRFVIKSRLGLVPEPAKWVYMMQSRTSMCSTSPSPLWSQAGSWARVPRRTGGSWLKPNDRKNNDGTHVHVFD